MSEDDIGALVARVQAMSEDERIQLLDPICEGLRAGARDRVPGARHIPNRVIALACLDLYEAWDVCLWSRP